MRRYYYNNWLAKVLLHFSTCHTIALTWFVLSKRSEEQTPQRSRNHETIHAMQWLEVATIVGALIFVLDLLLGLSAWWYLLAGVGYYLWYVVEWGVQTTFWERL